jgi:hypothetical protein
MNLSIVVPFDRCVVLKFVILFLEFCMFSCTKISDTGFWIVDEDIVYFNLNITIKMETLKLFFCWII